MTSVSSAFKTGRPPQRAVALAAVQTGQHGASQVLGVRRPDDPDDELAGLWGLPAATRAEGETEMEALHRLATEKLGIELRDIRFLRRGRQTKHDYVLSMGLYEARIAEEPRLPAPATWKPGVTYYQAWRWMPPYDLTEAVNKGSLCARLYLLITRGSSC